MNRIFKLEIKRLLKTKSTYIIVGLAIFISATIAFCSGFVENSTILNANNTIARIYGFEAIKNNRNIEKPLEGVVSSEVFMDVINKYQIVHKKYGEVIPDAIYVREITPISEILYLIPHVFRDSSGSASTRILYELPVKSAATFYEQRSDRQRLYWDMEFENNPVALQLVQNREELVQKPFYFSSYSGWDTAGEYLGICIIVIIFLCGIIVAPVFSGEYQSESDTILRTTKYGRKQLAISKFIVSLLLSAILYVVCMVVYISICFAMFGTAGLQTSVQFINLLSPSPYTIGDLNLLTMFGGLLVILAMISFTLFLSTKCNTPIIAMVLSVTMLMLPLLLKILVGNFNFINMICSILPSSGTGLYNDLLQINYLHIGAWTIWSPYVIAIASVLYIFLFFILTVKSYSRHEVK